MRGFGGNGRRGGGDDWPPRRSDDALDALEDETAPSNPTAAAAASATTATSEVTEDSAASGTKSRPTDSLWQARRARQRYERDEVRRFTRRARNRRNAWLSVLGLVAFVVIFVVVGVFTPLLSVREVSVTGVERADEAAILASLKQLEGQPLAQVTDADVGALLEQFVLVQSYSVRTEPPSKLTIDIVERIPVGALESGGKVTVVDAVGTALWEAKEMPADIPRLALKGVDTPGFKAAAAASLALDAEFRKQVSEISAQSLDSITLTLRDGTLVVWGSAEDSDRKAEVLQSLVAATGGEPNYYDVSSPDNPVSRLDVP